MAATILIVDDNQSMLDLLQDLISQEGHKVVTASTAQTALQLFFSVKPDLVLLDVQLPHINGFELCRLWKANPETRLTPVVLVTGLSALDDRVRGLEAGADDFLSKPVHRSELLARVRSLLSLKSYTDELDCAESVIFALARSIEAKDPYTEGHCERLAQYSSQLGEQLGLPLEQIKALQRASVVHDLGKLTIPDAILLKPGRLTPDEFVLVREHPVVGERICSPLKSLRLVLPIIRHHHERLDGSGYPDGLKGEEIPLPARVLQVVDVYDALTTRRPYKNAFPPPQALAILHAEVQKGWWDPGVVRELEQLLLRDGKITVSSGGEMWTCPRPLRSIEAMPATESILA